MAPSPTGFVHLGSARTALYDYLFARRQGGAFVLRVEDTDAERNRPEYEAAIYEGLHWLGLRWDEGPDVGGDLGPYRQSERLDLYRSSAARLLETGAAYRCWCTREELQAEREQAERERRPYRYSRRCLVDPPRGRDEFVVRLRVPEGRLAWADAVRGDVEFELENIGDPVLVRNDGTPLYNFCVAIDDAEMRISHVLRGEEHISNTPAQLLVLDAMGYERPVYGHLPVIVGADRAKLSKRKHPEARLELFRELGYLPEAMVNYVALLGWNPGTERELFTLAELESEFDLERVQRSPAMFDWRKLDWLNGQYIRALPEGELAARLAAYIPELDGALLREAEPALRERLPRLEAARELLEYLWSPPGPVELDPEGRARVAAARDAVSSSAWDAEALEGALDRLREEHGWSRNALFKPVRQALTGRQVSPPIHHTLALLPREEALRRLEAAS